MFTHRMALNKFSCHTLCCCMLCVRRAYDYDPDFVQGEVDGIEGEGSEEEAGDEAAGNEERGVQLEEQEGAEVEECRVGGIAGRKRRRKVQAEVEEEMEQEQVEDGAAEGEEESGGGGQEEADVSRKRLRRTTDASRQLRSCAAAPTAASGKGQAKAGVAAVASVQRRQHGAAVGKRGAKAAAQVKSTGQRRQRPMAAEEKEKE